MNVLSRMNDFDLEISLKVLVQKERQLLHQVLEHIREVETRKLYLERAYSSMYEYLVKELQYSGSAAMRRIEAARLLKDIPEISAQIQDGSLNLSQIGELSKAIKEKNKTSSVKVSAAQKTELVSLIVGKSTQETQRDLAQALDIPITLHEKKRVQQDESVRLELTLTKELVDKLNQCRDLASHLITGADKSASYSELLEVLADSFIKKHSLKKSATANNDGESDRKNHGRVQQDKVLTPTSPALTNADGLPQDSKSEKTNKTLTSKTKNEVRERDHGCQFVDSVTGKRCGAQFLSQADHKSSRWANGEDHSNKNLQSLCAGHNQLKYRKECGIRLV